MTSSSISLRTQTIQSTWTLDTVPLQFGRKILRDEFCCATPRLSLCSFLLCGRDTWLATYGAMSQTRHVFTCKNDLARHLNAFGPLLNIQYQSRTALSPISYKSLMHICVVRRTSSYAAARCIQFCESNTFQTFDCSLCFEGTAFYSGLPDDDKLIWFSHEWPLLLFLFIFQCF